MKLVIGMTSNPKEYKMTEISDKTKIGEYEFEEYNEKDFFAALKPGLQKVNKPVDEDAVFTILMDLHGLGKQAKLGGCAISGKALNATRVSIMEMAARQLSRQVQETLKEHKKK